MSLRTSNVTASDQCQNKNPKLDQEEDELSDQLKQICDINKGREADKIQSSLILHQLAKVYRKRSPDMFSLIRSAALFNSALARADEAATDVVSQIEEDLQEVCKHILSLANAQDADLIAFSKLVKRKVNDMRKKIEGKLRRSTIKKIVMTNMSTKLKRKLGLQRRLSNDIREKEEQKIDEIEFLQKEIAADYTAIMSDVARYCEKVMGKAPCKFSIVGMGSLARKEITPYSDFEHIILLEETCQQEGEDDLNYFRWFSVIFQVILINLQETILPSVDVYGLNGPDSKHGNWFFDDSTRGISFDGMMPHACKFPLGRSEFVDKNYELIKPVKEMLEFLTSEEKLKQGYHLADILTKVCYVFGERSLYKEFETEVNNFLGSQSKEMRIKQVKTQIIEDLDNFASRSKIFQFKSSKSFNVKKEVYRSTTLFISALGRIHNISASSCFKIITGLAKAKEISKNAKHKLMYAIALACETRLRLYMKYKSQKDQIENKVGGQAAYKIIQDLIGTESVFAYFQIAYSLQCEISMQLKLEKRMHLYNNPKLLNCSLIHCFKDLQSLLEYVKILKTDKRFGQKFYRFDKCIRYLEEDFTSSRSDANLDSKQREDKLENIESSIDFAWNLINSYQPDDAVELLNLIEEGIQQEQQMQPNTPCSGETSKPTAEDQSTSSRIQQTRNPIDVQLIRIGMMKANCLITTNQIEKAKEALDKTIAHYERTSSNIQTDSMFAATLYSMGRCYLEGKQFDKALEYLERSLQIVERTSSDIQTDGSYAVTLHLIGRCYLEGNQIDKALEYLKRSLQIKKRESSDIQTVRSYGVTLHGIGCCYLKRRQFDQALEYFKRSLQIDERISSDIQTDRSYAGTLNSIGHCYLEGKKIDKALEYLERSLQIQERTSSNIQTDGMYAATLQEIGRCYREGNQIDKASKYFERSRQIQERTSSYIQSSHTVTS